MSKTTPYIDAEYYNNQYKPSKNARITGTFNNVQSNQMNFDSFRTRASEIVDRLLSGKVSHIGGIDAMSDTYAKELIRKSTAAFVEHWFIKGFVMADLNSSLNIGSLDAANIMKVEKFRNIAPLSALANLQKTGMWSHKAVGINLSKELHDAGINPTEILVLTDALAIFEQKGEGLNFHIEGDMSGELTGMAGLTRFIKILETTQEKSSFEIIGGTDEFTKTNVEFKRAGDVVEKAEALIYSAVVAPDAAGWWYKVEDGKTIIYMEVKDDQEETRFAISNAYPDKDGLYGVLGSTDNSAGLTEMKVISIIDNIASVSISSLKEYATIPEFDAEPLGTIGYIKNADDSYDLLLKSNDGTKLFRDFETIEAGVKEMLKVLQDDITIAQEQADAAKEAADEANTQAQENKQAITDANIEIGKKQAEVGLLPSGVNVIKSTGKFSSLDKDGVRQAATADDELVDRKFVTDITEPLESRTKELESKDGDNLKKTDAKSPVNTSNKLITEAEFNASETEQNERLQGLEDAEVLDDKVWNGAVQFDATGKADLSAVVDQNGDAFEFKAGSKLQLYIRHMNTNLGKDGNQIVDDATPIVYVIPSGAQSDTLGVILAATGIATATITNGNDGVDDFEIYKIIEAKSIKAVNSSYSKTESLAKFAGKATEQVAADAAIAAAAAQTAADEAKAEADTNKGVIAQLGDKKVSGGNLLSTAEVLATEKHVTDANNALDIKIMAAVKVIEDARIKYEKSRVLSYAERKTTGAFADRTLFSELAITITSGGIAPVGIIAKRDPVPSFTNLNIATFADIAVGEFGILNANAPGFNDGNGDFYADLSKATAATDTGIKYQYTALKDITNKDME